MSANSKLEEAIEVMDEAFYLLPVEKRGEVERIIDAIRNLQD